MMNLMKYFGHKIRIENYSLIIYYCGSCGVACLNTNRNFIGIEKDEKYFEIAKKRIEENNTDLFDL